jgi:hypothetical protein
MTGRNPNVFYEVGYAHALGKIVLLLTQNTADIPFDLQHHPHTIYGGKIEKLRGELVKKLVWAINEAGKTQTSLDDSQFEVTINDVAVPSNSAGEPPLVWVIPAGGFTNDARVVVRNTSGEASDPVSHIYLFTAQDSALSVLGFVAPYGMAHLTPIKAHSSDAEDGLEHQPTWRSHCVTPCRHIWQGRVRSCLRGRRY